MAEFPHRHTSSGMSACSCAKILLLLAIHTSSVFAINIKINDFKSCGGDGSIQLAYPRCSQNNLLLSQSCNLSDDTFYINALYNNLKSQEVCISLHASVVGVRKPILENYKFDLCNDKYVSSLDGTTCPNYGTYLISKKGIAPPNFVLDHEWILSGWDPGLILEVTDCSSTLLGCGKIYVNTEMTNGSSFAKAMSAGNVAKGSAGLLVASALAGVSFCVFRMSRARSKAREESDYVGMSKPMV